MVKMRLATLQLTQTRFILAPLNQTIFRVHADDGDDGEYGSVKYLIQAANGKMAINQTSGELHLVQKLDYEQTKLFECVIVS